MRIYACEDFNERQNRGEQKDGEYKRTGMTNAHSHALEIILSRAEIGRIPKETMTELHYLSLAMLAQKIRDKEVTPQEVTQHCLQRIEQLQPKLNAFAHLDAE